MIWCADITYLWTLQGWLYLAVVIDLYSRKLVGWVGYEQSLEGSSGQRSPIDGLLATKARQRFNPSLRLRESICRQRIPKAVRTIRHDLQYSSLGYKNPNSFERKFTLAKIA
jgi:putative transposase